MRDIVPWPGIKPRPPALGAWSLNHWPTREVPPTISFFLKKIYLFIYLFLAALGLRYCVRAFSSCSERGLLFVAVRGLLIVVACLCCGARVLGARASVVVACGLRSCGLWTSRAQAQQLWLTGLVAPRHVGSSRTRARTSVACIGRWILNHRATREVPQPLLSHQTLTKVGQKFTLL